MLQKCKSKCSGVVRPYCTIGVNDLALYECFECGSYFSNPAILNNLRMKHGMHWESELIKLKELRKVVRFMTKKLQVMGFNLAEAVYLDRDMDHVEPDKHVLQF